MAWPSGRGAGRGGRLQGAPEYGITITNGALAQANGYTGEGVVTANVDTGVRWTHGAARPPVMASLTIGTR